jgi:hypothetical protein
MVLALELKRLPMKGIVGIDLRIVRWENRDRELLEKWL